MENNRERLDIKSTRQTFYAGETDIFDVRFYGGTISSDGTQYTISNVGRMNFKVNFSAFHKYASIKSVKIKVHTTTAASVFEVHEEMSLYSDYRNNYGVYGSGENNYCEVELVGYCNEAFLGEEYFSLYFIMPKTIYTASAEEAYQPQLIIEYIDDKESILNQKTAGGSVAQALNYGVNVRTGRPTFTKSLLNINTTVLPINLGLYFDPLKATETDFYMPKGWRFNYQQRVIQNGEEYEYIDGSGLRHRFKASYNNSNVFFDIAGTGLILTKSNSTFTMDDGYKQTLTFDRYGRLTKIIKLIGSNQYGLQFSYLSTFDNISAISEYRKTSSATAATITQKVAITYENSYTMKITSTGFPTITISSDTNNQMIRIMEEDSRVSTYTYNSASLLASATSDNGEKTLFTYDANNRVKTVNDYIVAKTDGSEDKLLSSMTFAYKYLSTHITNYFGVTKGYSFSGEGELTGEYEIVSNTQYSSLNSLDKENEYIQIVSGNQASYIGFSDISLNGNSSTVSNIMVDSNPSLSYGNFVPDSTKYSNLSFVYNFIGANKDLENAKSYVIIKQGEVEITRFELDSTKQYEVFVNHKFKFVDTTSVTITLEHEYDSRTVNVRGVRISEVALTKSHFVSNFKTKYEMTENDLELSVDSETYYSCLCDMFTCSASSTAIEGLMHYEDLVETQKNMALNPSSFNLWYNKKRGLVANINDARIPAYVDGYGVQKSISDIKLGIITVNENQTTFTYSDYSSSDAFRIDYQKVIEETNGVMTSKIVSQAFINNKFQTLKTVDDKGIINSKSYDDFGRVTMESVKNSTNSDYIRTYYSYGTNLQLQSEGTIINGTLYWTNYETDYYTCRLKKITYPNGLVEEIQKVDGTIDKFKKLSASVNGINSNELSYNTRKDLIEKFQAHANGLSLTYDDYNMMKEFKNHNNVFWTKTRSMNTNGYSETTTISNDDASFIRINSYDKYGNLYDVAEVNNGSHRTIAQLFYSDFDADSITTADPNASSLNKKSNSKLRKKIDNKIQDTAKYYYNNIGNIVKETHTRGLYKPAQISYVTDQFNRLINKNYDITNGNTFIETVQYKNGYSDEVESYAMGVLHNPSTYDYTEAVVTYEKDNLGRIISETTTIGSVAFKKQYTYQGTGANATNLISQMVVKRNGVSLETYNYTYDNMGRIINVAITNANGTVNNRYTYDLLGRLVREDNERLDTTTLFEYDTNGNMLNKSVAGHTTSNTVTTNPPHSFTLSSDYADYIESYDGKAIETSSIGNITEVGTTTYSWTRAKLLSQVKKSATDYVNYNYDGEGLRISKSHYNNGVTTTHTYIRDGKKILVEKINNGTTEKVLNYLYLGENVIGFVYNNAYYHFQKNLQNDIIAIYNESGIKIAAYEYDAWGNHTITLDTNSIGSLNPFRYRGYYYDSETGLFWCNSRYYNPEWGRWISPDSIEYLDPQSINGLNLYAYCGNDPVNRFDPSGHIALWLLGGIVLGAIGLIGGGVYAGVKSSQAGNSGWSLIGDIALGSIVGGVAGFAAGALLGAGISGALTGSFASSVKDVIAGGIRVYQMAKYGGGAAASYMMLDNLSQSFHHTEHVFWSGGDIAMNRALDYASQNGAKTLEMTNTGSYLSTYFSGESFNPLAWNIASQNFANQVHYGETVRAILYYPGMRETAIWFSEEVILLKRLVEIILGGL